MSNLYINDFSGSLNQHSSPDLIPNNGSPMMVNVTQDQDGSIAHRLGTTAYNTTVTVGDKTMGAGVYDKTDGTHEYYQFFNGQVLKRYTGPWPSTTDIVDTGLFSTTSNVEFAQFINRLYFIGSEVGDYLRWTTGSGSTVVSGNIPGKYLTVSNNRLLVGGDPAFPRRIYYSVINSDKFNYYSVTAVSNADIGGTNYLDITTSIFTDAMSGFKLENVTDGTSAKIVTYVSATRVITDSDTSTWNNDNVIIVNGYFDTEEPMTAMIGLGEANPVLVFDQHNCYVFDPDTNYSRKRNGFGCSSHRSLKVLQGNAIWLSHNGFYRFSSSENNPVKISTPIENELTGNAVFNKIVNFTTAAAGIKKNKYYCSVGNLSGPVKGITLNSCMLVFDLMQQSWSIRTYTTNEIGSCFINWVDSNNQEQLLVTTGNHTSIYQIDSPNIYTDDGSTGTPYAVTATFSTKHFEFKGGTGKNAISIENIKQLIDGHLKIYNSSALTIKYALDGATTYTTWTTTNTTPIGYDWHRELMRAFADNKFKTISIQVTGTGNWILYGIGLGLEFRENTELRPI